ncbi:hypothetical protein JB92DRAFT_2996719 [Gautieria morchelliformis]|nr:hypothetical protein JB92DRAFT_2996719 [Gautieria morchelliformis]
MAGEHEPASKRKPPIAVPLTLIAFGAAAVVVPILLLRRTRGTVRDLQNAPPPQVLPKTPVSISHASSPAPARRFVESQPEETPVVELQTRVEAGVQTASSPFRTGGVLYALKALGIATCIVGTSAFTGVFVVRWAMGVQSAEEFAACVRTKIQSLTPMLSSRIYQHHSEPLSELENGELEDWRWAEAAERLTRAYEEGGLTHWMAVAEKELELEVNAERKRRAQREGRPAGS